MAVNSPKILIADDEELWQDQINRDLQGLGYTLVNASSGQEALDMLSHDPCGFDLVILDKYMDGISGMDVLRQIKADPYLKILPVILETADTSTASIQEGIAAGAYYYLTKPFLPTQLQAVVVNALSQHHATRLAQEELLHLKDALQLIEGVALSFRSREQARWITALLSSACHLTMVQEMGLMELMLNAVEHGNLAITYDEKTQLINENKLEAEIDRRLSLPEYAGKTATVKFKRYSRNLVFTIFDQGDGFDWVPYLNMQIERINDNHGRGIAMANNIAFTHLQYRGTGNIVEASIFLPE